MDTDLRTTITVKDICEGFVYNESQGKGLHGLSGKLTIQPEYQRNYIYAAEKKEGLHMIYQPMNGVAAGVEVKSLHPVHTRD